MPHRRSNLGAVIVMEATAKQSLLSELPKTLQNIKKSRSRRISRQGYQNDGRALMANIVLRIPSAPIPCSTKKIRHSFVLSILATYEWRKNPVDLVIRKKLTQS